MILIWLCALSLVGVVLYVLGTYLVYAYDHRLVGDSQDRPNLSVPRRMRAIICEILATWGCVWLYLLGFFPQRIRSRRVHSIPILLIHGFNHNRSAWFPLKSRLKRAGFDAVYTLNLPRGNQSIFEYAATVLKYARQIEHALGIREIILIGHSMGGLIACACAQQLKAAGKITHVMTIGAPLHGTRMAVLANARAAHDMRQESPFTTELIKGISFHHFTKFYHIGSWFDNIVLPSESALLGKNPGHERMFDDLGHLTLLYSRQVASQIIQWLRHSVHPLVSPSPIRLNAASLPKSTHPPTP